MEQQTQSKSKQTNQQPKKDEEVVKLKQRIKELERENTTLKKFILGG